MMRNGYRVTSAELRKNYEDHYANRKEAQKQGAAWKVLKPLADLEHNAWCEYVAMLRHESPDKRKFIVPSRPL